MTSLPQQIDHYLSGIQVLRQSLAGMTPEQLRARPVAGKWSSLELLCHLADFEPILADRMKRVLAEDNPLLVSADENRFASRLAYHERQPDEELAVVEHTRRQMARILAVQQPDVLSRVGTHNVAGPRTLEQLLVGATNHLLHHVRFLHEKRRALGLAG